MLRTVGSLLRRASVDSRGNITILAAVAMPVVVGSLGLGAEVASWYGGKRALQNAADSAAIAAATNASEEDYDDEARAVAARYGFRHGVDGVTVTASNTAPCPTGGNECFSVVINRVQPLMLAQVIGFGGDAQAPGGGPAKLIAARAVAMQVNAPREYCVLALASSGEQQGIRTNGAPNSNLTGCSVMSNSDAQCNGHDLNAEYGDAAGSNNGCGIRRQSNVPTLEDPFSALSSNIPSRTCDSYPMAPKKKDDAPLPTENMLHGLDTRNVIDVCGDVELSGPVLINSGADGTVLIIRNGKLDLKGYSLQTQAGSSLTVVFTGPNDDRVHGPVGKGTFDIRAPSNGPWKGMALYQDPALTNGVDISEAGNSPAWNITGLAYLPKASVTFSGVVNKASNGASCFGMVVDNLTINGTAEILSQGECKKAGLILPSAERPGRGQLVS